MDFSICVNTVGFPKYSYIGEEGEVVGELQYS